MKMLYMILIKASPLSENEERPSLALMKAMDDYNDALEKAKVKVMAKGLKPSQFGYRFNYDASSNQQEIIKGPFDLNHELISGFFLIDVKDEEEALFWAKQCPDPIGKGYGTIELRALY